MYNQVCWVCLPKRDGMEPIGGELALARRRFLLDQRHAVSIDRDQNIKGFKGRVKGRIGRRRFFWRMKVRGTSGGEIALEEAFGQKNGWTMVVRDMYGVIVSRSFFDKQHLWQRTEYYEPWDTDQAKISFSPGGEAGTILRRDWDPEEKKYQDMTLYTVPYRSGTAGQSVVDAQFGEPQLVLVMTDGELCCCPKEEAKARQEAMKNVNSGTVVLMPAWEIKGGELVREDSGDGETGISFTSLEEYAKIEPPAPDKPEAAPAQPAPKHLTPPAPEEPAPRKAEPVAELPVIEPHEARHMQGSVNFEELIDAPAAPLPPPPAAPPVPAAPAVYTPRRMEPETLIPELEMPGVSATAPVSAVPPPAPVPSRAPVPVPETAPVPAPMPAPMPEPETIPPRTPLPMPGPETVPTQAPAPMAEPEPLVEENPDGDADLETILAEAALYANTPPLPEASPETAGGKPIPSGYTGDIKDGKISGRGRTEQRSGLTSYEGDYVDGRRHGFGTYYYKDGNLCYAGAWKDDRRDGLGVSFRDSDHAMHVANWKDGQPQGLVTLFDSKGNLRFSGRMENGKKEGAGVTINCEDGTVFVGQWSGGEATGLGSAFDRDGRLLYYGSWRDGKRHGHGTEFDINGGVVFDGEFRDGKYYNGVLYQKL